MIEVVFYSTEAQKPETHNMKHPPMKGDIIRKRGFHYEVSFRVWRHGSNVLEVYLKKVDIHRKFDVLV